MADGIVKFTINAEGDAVIDLQGFHGKGCAAVQEGFHKALGTEVEHRNKPEFFETTNVNQTKLTN